MKLLIASDLHYSVDLAAEMQAGEGVLPAGEYDHQRDGKLYWHNEILVEQMGGMVDALAQVVAREQPDLTLFLGDLVNTNWSGNVQALAEKMKHFPGPVAMVTGNHDLYYAGAECEVAAALMGEATPGMRTFHFGEVALIVLDLFVCSRSGLSSLAINGQEGATIGYREQDVAAALAEMDRHPDVQFMVCGHFPICDVERRLVAPGRKIGRGTPSGAALAARLEAADNFRLFVAGHQHFAHLQRVGEGIHWTVPALAEYPCAAAVVEFEASEMSGRVVIPVPELAERSVAALQARWTAGLEADRNFRVRFAKS